MDVPELVRQRALSAGAAGRRWLTDLPGIVETLADRWQLTVGSPYAGEHRRTSWRPTMPTAARAC